MIPHTESRALSDASAGESSGISFSVTLRGSPRRCIVTREALLYISRGEDADADLMSLFRRYEFRIYRLARMLVAMGIKGTPLVMGPWTFRIDALTYKGKMTPY